MGLYINNAFIPCIKINSAITPWNTLSISSNGIYDIAKYASINVNVIDNLEKRLNGTFGSSFYEDLLITSIAKYAFADLGDTNGYASGCNFPNVTTIGDNAFYWTKWHSGTVNLNFPKCENIGSGAFDCANMGYGWNPSIIMSFPKCKIINDEALRLGSNRFGSSVLDFPECIYIGDAAFTGGSVTITSVHFPKCSHIGDYVFNNFSLLTSINFPACEYIGTSAFYSCISLTSVNISNCTYLGDSAFAQCSALTSVNIPKCSYIGANAFTACINLTQVNLSKCEWLSSRAFKNCSQLTTVSLPVCSRIGDDTFQSCYALQSLYLLSTAVVSLDHSDGIRSTPLSLSTYTGSFGSIYVPSSLLTAYKSARNWSAYSARFVGV